MPRPARRRDGCRNSRLAQCEPQIRQLVVDLTRVEPGGITLDFDQLCAFEAAAVFGRGCPASVDAHRQRHGIEV
tara:strand:+ start:307 stop:528 length:222 start_codon:yes stop_codon:yes gene_type:complete